MKSHHNAETTNRYSRQELLVQIGKKGQEKIGQKHVLLIGAGALGTANAEVLVRAGIGKITIIDRDYVETSNLQRQQLFTEEDAMEAIPKAIAVENHLSKVNHKPIIETYVTDITAENIEDFVVDVDVIVDCTDNFSTRLLINDLSQKRNIPWVYGACVGTIGVIFTILPGKTPCLHCVLESMPTSYGTCDTVGILPSTVKMVSSFQTAEIFKILVEDWNHVNKKLMTFDLWSNEMLSVNVDKSKKTNCPSCGENPTYPFLKNNNHIQTATLCGRTTVQISRKNSSLLDLNELAMQLQKRGNVKTNSYLLHFKNENTRFVVFQDGRTFIHDVSNSQEAKQIYHQFFG